MNHDLGHAAILEDCVDALDIASHSAGPNDDRAIVAALIAITEALLLIHGTMTVKR